MLVANDPNNNPIELQADSDGNLKTSITGSLPNQVAEILGHNALAITDTASYTVTIDTSNLGGRKSIFIYNLLNQAVNVTISALPKNGIGVGTIVTSKSAPAGGSIVISTADNAGLADPYQKIMIKLVAAVAPTSGTITTYLEGVAV